MAFKEKALNIDKALREIKRIRSRISRVGVELEGWWDTAPQKGVRILGDGSVIPTDDSGRVIDWPRDLKGEINSPILEPSKVGEWMRTFYPNHSNYTCGLHVHISFKNALCYSRCMTEKFPATIVEYIKRWAAEEKLPDNHPLWPRLEGKNEFCQHMFHADEQAKDEHKDFDHHRKGHRYTVISYRYACHSTLESRLLSMFDDCEQAVRAVERTLDITNAFLFTDTMGRGAKEPKIKVPIAVDPGKMIQEIHISV